MHCFAFRDVLQSMKLRDTDSLAGAEFALR